MRKFTKWAAIVGVVAGMGTQVSEYFNPPITSYITGRYVMSDRGPSEDSTEPLQVPQGHNIRITYRVSRHINGVSTVERFINTPEGHQIMIDTFDRKINKAQLVNLIVDYKIPSHLPTGCGYQVYSRVMVSIDYNLLSLLKPSKGQNDAITFCVVEKR